MLRTIGHHSPAVYWRRRLVLLASIVLLVVLFVLTVKAVAGGNGSPAAAANSRSSSPSSSSSSASPRRHVVAPPPTHSSASASAHSSQASSAAAPPQPCTAVQLKVSAVAGQSSYAVGAQPVVMLQVTNTGPKSCVQGLGSTNVELHIYNGESRVWGSNDCSPDSTPVERTLAVNAPVRVSVVWSGLTSQPHCAGTRQRVGAGTYTLYALLDGRNGTATQFALS
jgi:cytoskeletal protein RodZ